MNTKTLVRAVSKPALVDEILGKVKVMEQKAVDWLITCKGSFQTYPLPKNVSSGFARSMAFPDADLTASG